MLNTRGIPKSGLLSISAGGMRKQVQLSALDRPLRFPADTEISQIKVDVLDVLGRARVPYNPGEQKYTLPLEAGSGDIQVASGEAMEVDVIIRPCESPSSPANQAKDGELDTAARRRKEIDASGYLEEHGLVNFMQFLLHSLMQDKPANPYPFLQKQVAMRMESQTANGTVASPSSPSGGQVPPLTGYPMLNVPAVQDTDLAITSLLQNSKLALMPTSPQAATSPEDIANLEREALEASQRMRADNALLREAAEQMKLEYEKLMQESKSLHGKLDAKRAQKEFNKAVIQRPPILPFASYYSRFVSPQCGLVYWNTIHSRFWSRPDNPAALAPVMATKETRTQAAYREIEKLQDEVELLARENAKLVADLARGREMIDLVRQDMLEIRRSVGE